MQNLLIFIDILMSFTNIYIVLYSLPNPLIEYFHYCVNSDVLCFNVKITLITFSSLFNMIMQFNYSLVSLKLSNSNNIDSSINYAL